jgi:nucleoside phosphorylase
MEEPSELIDICVICALPEEVRAFLEAVRQECHSIIKDGISPRYQYSYHLTKIRNDRNETLNLHISWLPRYGSQEMTLHLSHILEEYHPCIIIMTGICAGDPRRVQLGDLVVADRTFTYDNGKFISDEYGRRVHEYDAMTYELQRSILQFIRLFNDSELLIERLERASSQFGKRRAVCHVKPMASGSAVRADSPFEEIRIPVRETAAIDMEGASLGLVMSDHRSIPWLVVKGVSDYADQTKNDDYHKYAAHTSALYALSFIQAYVIEERMPKTGRGIPIQPPPAFNSRKQLHRRFFVFVPLLILLILGGGGYWIVTSKMIGVSSPETVAQQDSTLNTYINDINYLINHDNLKNSQVGDPVRATAITKTAEALKRLDSAHQVDIIWYIYQSKLIYTNNTIISLGGDSLEGDDFTKINLLQADLQYVDLRNANFEGIPLSYARLTGANLMGAKLAGTYLQQADLGDAKILPQQLTDAFSLFGLVLPDGSTFPSKTWGIPGRDGQCTYFRKNTCSSMSPE